MEHRQKISLFNGYCQSNKVIDQHDLFFRNIFYVLDKCLCSVERLDSDILALRQEYIRRQRYDLLPSVTSLPVNLRYDFDYLLTSLTPLVENTISSDLNKYFNQENLKKHKPYRSELIKVIKSIYGSLRNNSVHYNEGNFGSKISLVGSRPLIYTAAVAFDNEKFPPSLWIDNAAIGTGEHLDFFSSFSALKTSLLNFIDCMISMFAFHFKTTNPQIDFDSYILKKK